MSEKPPTDAELRSYDAARLAATMQQHQATGRVLRQQLAEVQARGDQTAVEQLSQALKREEERIEWLHEAIERKREIERAEREG